MNDAFTSNDASTLVELVGKIVAVRTKQLHVSKGVVHTVDPVTKRYGHWSVEWIVICES